MKKIKFVILSVVCALFLGCAANSVQELKSSPGYYQDVVVERGYQDSLKIVKDEYSSIQGADLSCTVYTDAKRGECTGTGSPGVFIFISTEYISDTSSKVKFYTAVNNPSWHRHIERMITKLNE